MERSHTRSVMTSAGEAFVSSSGEMSGIGYRRYRRGVAVSGLQRRTGPVAPFAASSCTASAIAYTSPACPSRPVSHHSRCNRIARKVRKKSCFDKKECTEACNECHAKYLMLRRHVFRSKKHDDDQNADDENHPHANE